MAVCAPPFASNLYSLHYRVYISHNAHCSFYVYFETNVLQLYSSRWRKVSCWNMCSFSNYIRISNSIFFLQFYTSWMKILQCLRISDSSVDCLIRKTTNYFTIAVLMTMMDQFEIVVIELNSRLSE